MQPASDLSHAHWGSTDDQDVKLTAAQERIDGQSVVLLVPRG